MAESKPSSVRIDCKYLAILAQATAAINSGSVELRSTICCVFEQYTIAPP